MKLILNKQTIKYSFIFLLSILFVSINSRSTSPFYVWDGCDSAIFKTMGLVLLSGKTPYVDFFDHKGPVLYFINALGEFIVPGRLGIFFLQIISSFIVFIYLYKLANLFVSKSRAFFILVLSVFIYSLLMEEGDICEEWELLAIVPSLYYSVSYILTYQKTKSVKFIGSILGVAFAFCVLIRPNDAISQIGAMALGVFLFLSFETKDVKYLLSFSCHFLLSFLLLSSPVFIYFASNGALPDLFYGLFGHNLMYANDIFSSAIKPSKISLLLFLLLTQYLISQSAHSYINFVLVPISLFSWLLIGGRLYVHYFIILIPIITLFFTFLVQQKNIVFVAICFLSFFSFFHNIQHIKIFIWQKQECLNELINKDIVSQKFYSQTEQLISNVPEEERNMIWNYNIGFTKGIYFSLFYHSNIVQCNKVPLYEMSFVDRNLADSDCLIEKKPLWVLLTHDEDNRSEVAGKNVGQLFDYFRLGYDFFETNYEQVARTDTTICNIELWRRKDINFEAE